jgi:hypothetical protein
MTRNKYGLPLIYDFNIALRDKRRIRNLEYMKWNCPKGWESIWSKKLDQLKKNINERKNKTLN